METEIVPVATVTGLYRCTFSGFEPLNIDTPLTLEEIRSTPVFYELELHPEQQEADLIVDVIYDSTEPVRLPDLVRGADIPRGVPFWIDWFEIPPYREMRDMCGRRVYPRAPGIHTVRFRTAKRKSDQKGKYRDFSPANGGWMSPYFEFAIATDRSDANVEGLQNAESPSDLRQEKNLKGSSTRNTRRQEVFAVATDRSDADVEDPEVLDIAITADDDND